MEIERAFFNSQMWLEGNKPPSMPINSWNTFNQNFEIAILFNEGERSENYVFEDDFPPPRALSVRVIIYALRADKVFMERSVV